MSATNSGSSEHYHQFLIVEYSEILSSWRYYGTMRFGILAFSITLTSFLVGVYRYFLTVELGKVGEIKNLALWTIPFLGMLSAAALVLLDMRIRAAYGHACYLRGREIEGIFGISYGHITRLEMSPQPFALITHTRIIWGIYLAMFSVWGYLFYKTATTAG